MINLNYEYIKIKDYPNGRTQNIEVKLGRKLYMLDIDKCANYVHIDFYKKMNKDRGKYSKYGVEGVLYVEVRENAILERGFFENIQDIKKAQDIRRKFVNTIP